MKQIRFDPKHDYPNWTADQKSWWDKWTKRAQDATTELLASDKVPRQFDSKIWSDLKNWLLDNFFDGKCAYCEINIDGGFFGEGEHFRPKSSVRVRSKGKLSAVTTPDGSAAHGGYYWLAYAGHNLLPSCDKCNNRKSDQFPVNSVYVFSPPAIGVDLDLTEDPLLIHPCNDNPSNHLKFGVAGIVAAIDSKGVHTIEVFGLDREGLTDLRKARQEEAKTAYAIALTNRILHKIPIEESMAHFTGKRAQFTAAVSDYLKVEKENLMRDL